MLGLNEKLNIINGRVGFHNIRSTLGKQIGVTARGINEFKTRAINKATKESSLEHVVDEFWKELLLSGKRFIRMNQLSVKDTQSIANFMKASIISPNDFTMSYPWPLDNASLTNVKGNLQLVAIETHQEMALEFLTATFCKKTFITVENVLPDNYFNDDGKDFRDSVDTIFYRSRTPVQCFHSLMLDVANQTLYISMDFNALRKKELVIDIGLMVRLVESIIGKKLGSSANLFPAIEPLYTQVDGRVSHISFITGEGHPDKLSLHDKKEKCLRHDTYHKAGETAVSNLLQKFAISKVWDIHYKDSSLPIELTLPGRRTMLDSTDILGDLIVSDCYSVQHVMFVIGKLLDALKNAKKQVKNNEQAAG
ncbi:hypothetical protein A1L58_06360 [Shewanella baltica]|uniref:hypothetical protein n=1 Tax=Shewanella baltica TaxID=62322 RepID=UPI0007B4CBE2|nr:hypothetical protein [Shewanella baltica]KZK65707.1 hypothetical protein A1L58_06360 [Shewanella baltica]